ncbi:hypothetical protein MAR_009640 [Mya arenaria]|uniref:DUF6589 domain-containing protein n=1 Tax=Mya arenaria TaxID=6604 RepID=A0ABY7DZC4_MYAAR|nr:hypothetical protein MAR_009640 [Mya arenaria]
MDGFLKTVVWPLSSEEMRDQANTWMNRCCEKGDIFRVSNMLKFLIPCLFKHSPWSKYMVECKDCILKTEIMLPQRLAIKVRMASMVKPKDKQGKIKPSDLQEKTI